jgi:arabinose-5-phosphate isomerase
MILMDKSFAMSTDDLPIVIFDSERALALAHQTFEIEAQALLDVKKQQGPSFSQAVEIMLKCQGKIIVMGMGKSGHVGRKIAATLASTGTPAMFVHPAEASHGDLGIITSKDLVLAISNSGESDELTAVLPSLRRLAVSLIVMTGKLKSTLAQHANVSLNCGVNQEACPLNLAPTASTTAQMAMGDALAVALLDAKGFKEEDFARSHPGGSLGRKLLTHVHDVMRSGDKVPWVLPKTDLLDMMRVMTSKGLGATAVTTLEKKILGIFTDGDLLRLLEEGRDIRTLCAEQVMHPSPQLIHSHALAVDAASLMEKHRITSILVVNDNHQLVGALNTNDLMRAKVI